MRNAIAQHESLGPRLNCGSDGVWWLDWVGLMREVGFRPEKPLQAPSGSLVRAGVPGPEPFRRSQDRGRTTLSSRADGLSQLEQKADM